MLLDEKSILSSCNTELLRIIFLHYTIFIIYCILLENKKFAKIGSFAEVLKFDSYAFLYCQDQRPHLATPEII